MKAVRGGAWIAALLAGAGVSACGAWAPPPESAAEEADARGAGRGGPGRRIGALDDEDGVAGAADLCPDQPEDRDGFHDLDGCPDLDNDEDGLLDEGDACPDEPEDRDSFEETDGCPDPDNDGDGRLDPDDECPNETESDDGYQDEDGCPDAGGRLVIVNDPPRDFSWIPFAEGSARIPESGESVLGMVVQVLEEHPEIEQVLVEGHASVAEGSSRRRIELSRRRAEAVRAALVERGIGAERLAAVGVGSLCPAGPETDAFSAENERRIRFVILKAETEEAVGTPGCPAAFEAGLLSGLR